jgi:3-phytase
MKLAPALVHTTIVLALSIGCSRPRSETVEDTAGAIGLALQVGGHSINSASYTLTGPGGFSRMGTIDLGHSNTFTAIIGGIPAGTGYNIALTAGATGVACQGSASFAVVAKATTTVMVKLACREAPRNGSVMVQGTLNLCPVIDSASSTPAEVNVGSSLALSGSAHDADVGPQALSYAWTAAPGVSLSGASSAHAQLTCLAPGPVSVTLTVSDGDCTESLVMPIACTPAPVLQVYATGETDPVPHAGDAADDPAIWVNPADPALSTIIGTDKTAGGGLGVYDLAGHQLQFVTAGELNNVDLRTGFPLGGQSVALVTAGNRTDNSIAIYKVDPATRQLVDVKARTITTLTTYGSCMYHSAATGKFYYFVDSKAGDIEQWELFDNGAGLVDAVKVRNLPKLGSQPEACTVDDELGFLYVGEEDVGIWKFNAEPGTPDMPTLVDGVGPGGHLVADVEGLAIARTGAGTGFLIAANQGDSTYAVYQRGGSNAFVKLFRVGASCAADEVTGSDGIDVTTAALGPAFPGGVLVTQDDTNSPTGNQNFKLVPLADILGGNALPPVCATPDGGAPADAVPPGPDAMSMDPEAGAGFPEAFCNAFCGKCATCWDPPGGFSEGDCLYQLSKPNFALSDCLAGCAAGKTPGFSPANLPANWEALACLEFDGAI